MGICRRHAHTIAAVAIMATIFAMSGSVQGAGTTLPREIDLTGPVTASTCSPCHARIAESPNPELVFSHGVHIKLACSVCHVRPAHEAGVTHSPSMRTCFACHGLAHSGAGVIAADDCGYCHTSAFPLRPAYHGDDWIAQPHARAVSRGGFNDCLMCHDARAQCDACHQEMEVDTPPTPPIYLRIVPAPEPRPSLVVRMEDSVAIGQCVFCHSGIDEGSAEDGLIFTHTVHLERDYRCEACHEAFPHTPDETTLPTMRSCYRCHSVQHAGQGEVATEDCLACHPSDFNLVPADHTPDFIARDHSGPAGEDLVNCTMCHTSPVCAECHRGERQLADGSLSAQVIPDTHERVEWIAQHGAPYLGGRGGCSICHTSESCSRCHQTAMPHPTAWLASHAADGDSRDDCGVCHTDRATCQECHHASVRNAELRAENCVDCHPEATTEPPTAIRRMGFVSHAVHFDVAERVGRSYVCDDCHIGLTVARVRGAGRQTYDTGAHDLRVCYDCHGALDFRNVEIAPWPGSQLCRRCHADLNI